jgi:hypothetical protein
MHTIEIPDINFKVEIASQMQELTDEQFQYFVGLLLQYQALEITLPDIKVAMVLKMLGVHNGHNNYNNLPTEAKMYVTDNVNRIIELLDFLFVPEGDKIAVNLAFTRNFVRQLNVQNVLKLYGPADALTDITFLEYKDAGTYYRAYQKTGNEADLNKLVAVLYRPKNWLGKKKPYVPEQMHVREARIAKLPLNVRFSVFLFFQACENFLRTASIEIDGQDINLQLLYETTLTEKQKGKTPKYENNTGLAGVALSLAATGIFGPIEKVYSQNLYDVLVLLYKQRVEYLNLLENN